MLSVMGHLPRSFSGEQLMSGSEVSDINAGLKVDL